MKFRNIGFFSLCLLQSLSAQASNNDVGGVDCTQLQQEVLLEPFLTLRFVVTLETDETTQKPVMIDGLPQGELLAQLSFQGRGWVGMGFSENGAMAPGEAVIGLPNLSGGGTANPGKYLMSARDIRGVRLMDIERQTLRDAKITQNETTTVLEFRKILIEDGELPINGNGTNNIMWAVGGENALSEHSDREPLQITLVPCIKNAPLPPPDVQSIEVPGAHRELWVAHGVLAGVAWAILAPMAIASALLRNYLGSDYGDDLWFKLHRALNALVILCTASSLICAWVAHNRGFVTGSDDYERHRAVGYAVFTVTAIQILGGIVRPSLHDEDDPDDMPLKKTMLRRIWEILHRLVGLALLALAWWQTQSGLKLFADRFDSRDIRDAFWGVVGGLSGFVIVLYLLRRFW